MNIVAEPVALAKVEPRESHSGTAMLTAVAFCRVALPIGEVTGIAWHRDTPAAAISIISSAAEDTPADARPKLPTGTWLRLLLMHIVTQAVAADSAAVDMGDSPASLATAMMLDFPPDQQAARLAALAEQYARLCACKITVSIDGAPALPVFDARGRPRAASDWRPALRLNARFFEQLARPAEGTATVALDRRILVALSENPMALDAYAWIAASLPQLGASGTLPVTWQELHERFGGATATLAELRNHFEQSLQQVSAAWPSVRLIIGEEGVELRRSEREGRPLANIPVATALVDPAEKPKPPEPAAAISEPAAPEPIRPVAVERPRSPEPPQPAPRDPEPSPPAPAAFYQAHDSQDAQRRQRSDRISLKSHLTGLQQVVWLLRGGDGDEVTIEVTPGSRYDPQNVTVLALEPIIVQISGGLYTRDFERMAAWVNSNRDLIDDVWYEDVELDDEILARVKKVPPPGWR